MDLKLIFFPQVVINAIPNSAAHTDSGLYLKSNALQLEKMYGEMKRWVRKKEPEKETSGRI